jgi:4-amino-4-deoxy-L-arabinose transferase-like glycosyltransferase
MDSRRLTLAAAALFAVVVLVRPTPLGLFGVDGACYARIARDLAAQPVATWADVRWDDGAFHEHPPLALWLEAGWFRVFGATAAAAVWLARTYALLLGAVVFLVARKVSGLRVAALSLVGLSVLPSFIFESQNPMFEGPLTLAFACALWATTRLKTSRLAVLGFAVSVVAAFWVKGVPAFAGGALLGWALWQGVRWPRVVETAGASVALLLVTALGFEAWSRASGLTTFFSDYAHKQLVTSFVEGRGNPVSSPFFYAGVLLDWHLAFVVALPMVALHFKRLSTSARALASLGLWHAVLIVVGFSFAKQKNTWYLAPLLPGAAWVVGVALSALVARARAVLDVTPLRRRALPMALVLGALAFGGVQLGLGTSRDTPREAAIRAVAATPLEAQRGSVANCSVLGEWVGAHLFEFHWHAAMVACDAPAQWRFDGRELTRTQ